MKKLVIIGASGHGKVVADIARLLRYEEICFLDDNSSIKECIGYPVVGKLSDICKFSDWDFFIAIGNAKLRCSLYKKLLESKVKIATLIHPSSFISDNVMIGEGSVIMAGSVINPNTIIGKCCIINTCSSIDHDNVIGDFVHISVGSHLAGNVSIGNNSWLGIGSIVSNNVSICNDCLIGAGGVVVKNIYLPGTYVGVPIKKINKKKN